MTRDNSVRKCSHMTRQAVRLDDTGINREIRSVWNNYLIDGSYSQCETVRICILKGLRFICTFFRLNISIVSSVEHSFIERLCHFYTNIYKNLAYEISSFFTYILVGLKMICSSHNTHSSHKSLVLNQKENMIYHKSLKIKISFVFMTY